jgi:predicted O-methyltransferase YrrM
MYSRYQLIRKYLHYYIHASNGKGHGVHSPFVFDFIKNVLNDKTSYADYKRIESIRESLLHNKTTIQVEDLGAGSVVNKTDERQICRIAASSLKPRKYAQLLYRMVKYYQPMQVIELGTSLGVTTAYLASAAGSDVHSLEGAAAIAQVAKQNFAALGLTNINLHIGNFDTTFPTLLRSFKNPALVFIDGNHRKLPTLDYFRQLLATADETAILVFDDIHWSADMEEAWELIKSERNVTLSIDLFFIGIVFFRRDFKVKQHFSVRF